MTRTLATQVQPGDQITVPVTKRSMWGEETVVYAVDVTKVTTRGGKVTFTGEDENGTTRRLTVLVTDTLSVY